MRRVSFPEAIAQIIKEDPRFSPEAYLFVMEALDFTTKMLSKPTSGPDRHASADELLEGIRKFALREYGQIAMTVLNSWGIYRCGDFGHIVFNLVAKKVLRKSDNDSVQDFENGFDFKTAFQVPFDPESEKSRKISHKRSSE